MAQVVSPDVTGRRELARWFELTVGSVGVLAEDGASFVLGVPNGDAPVGLRQVALVRGLASLVAGHLHLAARGVELRTYEEVAGAYERRWDRPLPITPTEYLAFVARVADLADRQRLELTFRAPPHEGTPRSRLMAIAMALGASVMVALYAVVLR
jgi:hypothetical protein